MSKQVLRDILLIALLEKLFKQNHPKNFRWKWGESQLKFSYDRHGLLSEITSPQDGIQIFTYDETNMLTKITLASQRNFLLTYDDNGGLRHVTLPSGTKHSFALQPSLGKCKYILHEQLLN